MLTIGDNVAGFLPSQMPFLSPDQECGSTEVNLELK